MILNGNRIHDKIPPKYMVTQIYMLVNPIIIQIKGNDKKLEAALTNNNIFFFSTPPIKDVIIKHDTIQLKENIIPNPFIRL